MTSWCDNTPYSLFHLNCYYDIPDWTSFWVYGVTRAYPSFKQIIWVDSEFLLSCGEPDVSKDLLHPAGSLIRVVGDDILAQTLSKTTVTFLCHSNRPDFAVRLSDQRKGWLLPASISPASPRAPTEDRVAAVMRRFYALKLQVLRVVCLKGISAQRAVLTGIVTVQMHKQQQTLVSPTYPRGSTIDFK